MNYAELKQKAKDSLRGKYSEAVIMMLIPMAIGILLALLELPKNPTLSIISSVLTLLFEVATGFGALSFYLKISRDEEVDFKELFKKVDMGLLYFCITLLVGLFAGLWALLFIIPGIIAALSYSQAYLIALDNPEITPLEALRQSKELMRGYKLDYLLLNLSFIGWVILGAFTLGILYFWLIPYMSVTQMNFYNALLEEKNK